MKALDIQMARLTALTQRPVALVKEPTPEFYLVTPANDLLGVDLTIIEEGRMWERDLTVAEVAAL